MVFLGGAVWLFTAIMSARIQVTADRLTMVNVLTVATVDRADVRSVDGTNGLVVVTSWGRAIESVAYGRSVLQQIVRSRRCARVAGSIEDWRTAGPSPSESRAGGRGVPQPDRAPPARRREHRDRGRHRGELPRIASPRPYLMLGLPAMLVLAQLLGVVLWLSESTLRPIVLHGF